MLEVTVAVLAHHLPLFGGPAYFCNELVTRVSTSWFSSNSSIVPRYPNRLSAKRGEARSLRHSICPKCVRSPRVKRYSSFATLLRRTLESPLSSRKLARMAALSFWTTARSSAMVFEARTFRINCFTTGLSDQPVRSHVFWNIRELIVGGKEGNPDFCAQRPLLVKPQSVICTSLCRYRRIWEVCQGSKYGPCCGLGAMLTFRHRANRVVVRASWSASSYRYGVGIESQIPRDVSLGFGDIGTLEACT